MARRWGKAENSVKMTGKLRKKLLSVSVALCVLLSGNGFLPLLASMRLRADDTEISSEDLTEVTDSLSETGESGTSDTDPEQSGETSPDIADDPKASGSTEEISAPENETSSSDPEADDSDTRATDLSAGADPDASEKEDPDLTGTSDTDLPENPSEEPSEQETKPKSKDESTSRNKSYITYKATTASGIRVQAAATTSAFAGNVTMHADDVTVDAQMMAMANSSLEENKEVKDALAVDIRFIDDDGNVLEPLAGETVQVSITLPAEKELEGDTFSVLHMTDEGATEVEDADIDEKGGSFTAESFSIYVLTAVGEVHGQQVHDYLPSLPWFPSVDVNGDGRYTIPNSNDYPYIVKQGDSITLVGKSTNQAHTFGIATEFTGGNAHLSLVGNMVQELDETTNTWNTKAVYKADTPGMVRLTFADGNHDNANDFYIAVVPSETNTTVDMRDYDSWQQYSNSQNPYCVSEGDWIRFLSNADGFWFEHNEAQYGNYRGDGVIGRYMDTANGDGYKYNDVHARGQGTNLVHVTCDGQTRNMYVRVLPGKTLDHADIEIADGGKYTSTRIYIKNGQLYKQVNYYFTYVEEVNECILYQSNGETVRFFDGNGNTLWYDEAQGIPRSGYTRLNYAKNPNASVGQSQYELTSKYKFKDDGSVDPNSFSNIKFNYSDVDHASFDVKMYRILSETKTYKFNPNLPQGQEWEFAQSTAYSINDPKTPRTSIDHIVFDLTHTHVVDAYNKCPDHSGLDFTLHANSAMIQLAASKELLHGTLGDGAFQFELRDSSGNLIQQVANSADGTVLFDEIHFEKPGTYTYYISETVDPTQTNIHYDERTYKVDIKVTETTDGLIEAEIILPHRDLSDVDYKFVNEVMYTLPDTGGGGTAIFHQAGAVLLISAAILLFLKKAKVMDL